MSYTPLPSASIGALKPIIHSLWSLIKSNFDDHHSRINALESSAIPAGTIAAYGNSTPPTGWLACDATEVSQTTYADLYAIIGSSFNTGGETPGNFRLPDFKGRCRIGTGTGSGLTARAIGAKVGEETHVLTTGEMPVHTHTISESAHSHSGLNIIQAAGSTTHDHLGANGATQTPTKRTNSRTTGVTANNSGSNTAHNNMQPWQASLIIIKT